MCAAPVTSRAPRVPRRHRVTSTHYLPARCQLAKFTGQFAVKQLRGALCSVTLDYEDVVKISQEVFSGMSWTRMQFSFELSFDGDGDSFAKWCQSDNGFERLVDTVLLLQNAVIDDIKSEHSFNPSLSNLRHFGPSEWPYVGFTVDGVLVAERANAALRPMALPVKPTLGRLSAGTPPEVTFRGLVRACDLADCGYPTEAVLIAFAILDATVQRVLLAGMTDVGLSVNSANALLRNTTQSRLATYLNSILKLLRGHSLEEDRPSLYASLSQLNKTRNDAIHSGIEVTRSDARNACITVFDVLEFLDSVGPLRLDLPPRPKFLGM